MSKPPILLPAELVEAVMRVVNKVNQVEKEEDEIHIITIAVRGGSSPVVVSSLEPESMHEVLRWLIEREDQAAMDIHNGTDKSKLN